MILTSALVAVIIMQGGWIVLLRRMVAGMEAVDAPRADADREAGEAVLELLEAKLTDCPSEWEDQAGTLTHRASGVTVIENAGTMIVSKGALRFMVPEAWHSRMLRACQLRNAKIMVASLTAPQGRDATA